MSPTSADPRPHLGWREWVALPELGVEAIKAKIDTGARTSSLHAFDLEISERDGEPWVEFSVHPVQRIDEPAVSVSARVTEHREVRSSNGEVEQRPVIVTDVEVAGQRFPIEVTLTNRDEMGFRMLLGRSAVRDRFLVDPGESFLTGLTPAAKDARQMTPPSAVDGSTNARSPERDIA